MNTALFRKVATVVLIIASLSCVVLALLYMLDIWQQAFGFLLPTIGVVNLCMSYIQWNTSRKLAVFSIGVAVFAFICSIIILINK